MSEGFLRLFDKPKPIPSGPTVPPSDAYARAAFEGELEKVRSAPEGTRNHQLFASTCAVAELVNAGVIDEGAVRQAMADAAYSAGLGELEVQRTIDSAFDKTQGVVRSVPERPGGDHTGEGVKVRENQADEGKTRVSGDSPFGDFPPVDAFEWIFKTDDTVVELWGKGDDILWAEGEALMIAGGMGLGKSTLAGQLVRAQLGLQSEVLGLPVARVDRPILYMAMDRPAQLRRSLRRQFSEADQAIAAGRLLIRPGPPIMDMALDPTLLTRMAEAAGAGTVYVDSLKDAVVGLSGDEAAAMYNRGRQALLASGVNICELHHCRKTSGDTPPGGISSVYGSTWLTSGAGSVIILSGEPGDLEVKFQHAKTPANEVGPWKIHLNPDQGGFTVRKIDLLVSVRNAGPQGLTAEDAARDIYERNRPSVSEKKKAERQLDKLVTKGLLTRLDGAHGPVWFLAEGRLEAPKLQVVKDGMFGDGV